ncbi:MAG: dephospho-CoA kinase, partial [Bacteroidales bacterium]|nr:dephospho-CoA kinase [Bacteroidales bacterium]
MARRLGVTGGIGSGKTTVCRIFRVLGIPVFVADVVARDLMNNNEDVR